MVYEKLYGSVVVKTERANKVIVERRASTFLTVTGDSAAYFNKISQDLPSVYL